MTLIIIIFSLIRIIRSLFGGTRSTATASHILLDDSEGSKAKLIALKKDINNDYNKFTAAARQHSKCPSGKTSGGSLGTFGRGAMVPAFDKIIFDKDSKIHVVIGPVQTNFGLHLIYIEDRNLAE